MTATQTAPPVATRSRRRWRERWYRLVVPFAVLALLFTVTGVAHHTQEPNPRAAETLSPVGTGADGSSQLADLLTERGVQIEQVFEFTEAIDAVEAGGDAVVFLPKPNLVGAVLASAVAELPGEHRVVLVAPRATHLWFTDPPVLTGDRRWASATVSPGCALPDAVAAGRATALRSRYAVDGEGTSCYGGGLVHTQRAGSELFVIGADDPFRNRRIGEHGNAALAVGLLSAYDRVIWADSLTVDFDLNPQFQWPQLQRPTRGERDRTGGSGFEGLVAGYPPGVLTGLSLAALLALLVALARARRLGPPVSEPLPVVVPAAEAVAGRGRLYQRTRGRGVALTALRAAALPRLTAALNLPAAPPPEPQEVVAAIVTRTGLPVDHVRHTLYGPEPDTDDDLANAVATLDGLVALVTRDNPGRGEAP